MRYVQVTQQISQRGDAWRNGIRQAGDPEIASSQTQIRLGQTFELGGLPAVAYAQTSIGNIRPGGSLAALEGVSGMGDTTFMLALWPHANRDAQTYFGVAGYLVVPTGSYSNRRSFNMGDNRYRAALQAGYQAPLVGNLHGMAAVDAVWNTDNDDFGITRARLGQRPLYTAQFALLYDINRSYSLGVNYYRTTGGETQLNGVDRDDRINLTRYQVSATGNFSFGRLVLQYGRDLHTDNGYFEDGRWLLRYLYRF
jgi:hypothetical protein